MSKLNKVDNIVRHVLIHNPKSRENDFILIGCVYYKLGIDIKNKTMFQILTEGKSNKYPIFESVTRARRKLQREYPELSNATTVIARDREQEIYKEYNRS